GSRRRSPPVSNGTGGGVYNFCQGSRDMQPCAKVSYSSGRFGCAAGRLSGHEEARLASVLKDAERAVLVITRREARAHDGRQCDGGERSGQGRGSTLASPIVVLK